MLLFFSILKIKQDWQDIIGKWPNCYWRINNELLFLVNCIRSWPNWQNLLMHAINPYLLLQQTLSLVQFVLFSLYMVATPKINQRNKLRKALLLRERNWKDRVCCLSFIFSFLSENIQARGCILDCLGKRQVSQLEATLKDKHLFFHFSKLILLSWLSSDIFVNLWILTKHSK